MQFDFKVKYDRSGTSSERQRDFNDAVGLQVALLMGSDR
jgi:hypothetical protein